MESSRKDIFAHPSFRYGTIMSPLAETVDYAKLAEVRDYICDNWTAILKDLTSELRAKGVACDNALASCLPQKEVYEGLVVRSPSLPISFEGYDVRFRILLTLCFPPNRPKIFSRYSLVEFNGRVRLDDDITENYFREFLPLAKLVSEITRKHYTKSLIMCGLDSPSEALHAFDIRTVAVDDSNVRKMLEEIEPQLSDSFDPILTNPKKYELLKSCFQYLPPRLNVAEGQGNWLGLNVPLNGETVNVVYYKRTIKNKLPVTHLSGACYNYNYERENDEYVPAIMSGHLVRAMVNYI